MHNTILVRGRLFEKTPLVIKTIKKWFDGEIILSTWEHEDTNTYNKIVDKIVLTKDPGQGPIQQFKRQLVSYNEGIKHANGENTLCIRSDILCNENVFMAYDNIKKTPKENFKLFNSKILIGNMMSIDPDIGVSGEPEHLKYFRLCDWFQCGQTEDIKKFSNIISEVDNIKDTNLCTEQLWLLLIVKQNLFNNLDINKFESIIKFNWDIILNNFEIKNTRSSLKIENFNWSFQPEFLNGYITEQKFNNKYEQQFGI